MLEGKKSSAFIPGGQILTNIEDYSLKIRSEADAYAKKITQEVEQYQKEEKEAISQATKKRLLVEDEAAEIIAKAKEEAENLLEKSQNEGFEKGRLEAEKNFEDEINKKIKELEQVLDLIKNYKQKIYLEYEKDLLDLCILTAKKVIASELKTNPNLILNSLRVVAKKIEGENTVLIKVNPVDYEYIKSKSSQINELFEFSKNPVFKKEDSLKPGNFKIETKFSTIEKDIEKNMQQAEAILNDSFLQRKKAYKQNSIKF